MHVCSQFDILQHGFQHHLVVQHGIQNHIIMKSKTEHGRKYFAEP